MKLRALLLSAFGFPLFAFSAGSIPNPIGTQTKANSVSVTLPSNPDTQPVSLASVPTHAVTLGSTTITGTVAVTQSGTWNIGSITTLPALPTGANVIGHVIVDTAPSTAVTGPLTDTQLRASAVPVTLTSTTITGTVAVTGTFYQATQPVSLASLPALAAGSAVIGHVIVDTAPSTAVTNAGTFATQAAQSGTWNITNVSGTVSLPTGASTAAKQPALGTAGSASTDVLTVQGIASGTPIPVTFSGHSEYLAKFGTSTALTLTAASLATSTAGVGRQSTLIDNTTTRYQRVHVFAKVTTGTSPTASKGIYLYLLKADKFTSANILTDGAGTADAALTVVNAQQIAGAVTSATSNVTYQFDCVIQNPGPCWGLDLVHDTGVNLNSTGGNHAFWFVGENPEAQ